MQKLCQFIQGASFAACASVYPCQRKVMVHQAHHIRTNLHARMIIDAREKTS
ncbi:hypothetical protein JOJ88_002871 [Pantoea cypripedii]|nr:hypothetical protein [Pantoea cypripedii]